MAIADKMIVLAALFLGVVVGWILTLVTVERLRGNNLYSACQEFYKSGYSRGFQDGKGRAEEKKDGGTETE